tara:strand:+ start:632 stop:967 length:336 start_codon:yes stop_codon:yes gene_type:complete
MIISGHMLLREYIKSIAFPASAVKHNKYFIYKAQSKFPYKSKPGESILSDDEINEDGIVYVLKPKSSKNMAGSKRGWSSPHIPIGDDKNNEKKYFSLKSLLKTNKNFNNSR